MQCVGSTMMHLSLSVFSLLELVVGLTAAGQYGDYSVVHMPQYGAQHEDADLASGTDEYGDKSPDAPARLDYKYEEESHGKSDDLLGKDDVMNERIWDKPHKKKRKPVVSHNDNYSDLDKDSFDEVRPEFKIKSRFVKHRSRLQNKKFVTESEKLVSLIDQSEDFDSVENKNYYIRKNDDKVGSIDFDEFNNRNHRTTTQRKARRKARDRALYQSERSNENKHLKLDEELNIGADRGQYFESKSARRPDGIIDRSAMSKSNKYNYDNDEYFDMKRILNMKNRLPALYRRETVRTTEAPSTRYLEQWPNRRAGTLLENNMERPEVTTVALVTSIYTVSSISTTSMSTTSIGTTPLMGNSSELSLAEKSRLSILKKALRKEKVKNVSSTTKPPVLLQVTRKMPTVVMVEPRPGVEMALRAREVSEDSPERLKRARRLMRHKLVAGARSIHDLTDNWDEMVCDYIDVTLLDADAAPNIEFNNFLTLFFVLLSMLLMYS